MSETSIHDLVIGSVEDKNLNERGSKWRKLTYYIIKTIRQYESLKQTCMSEKASDSLFSIGYKSVRSRVRRLHAYHVCYTGRLGTQRIFPPPTAFIFECRKTHRSLVCGM